MTKLEKASGGRGVMLIRAEPKSDQFLLLARDREVAQVSHVYFLHKELRMWLFARNRTKTGFNPNAVSAGGMNDVGDVKQRVITYLMEIPFLYSVMIGSFLLLFVPQCVCAACAAPALRTLTRACHTAQPLHRVRGVLQQPREPGRQLRVRRVRAGCECHHRRLVPGQRVFLQQARELLHRLAGRG